MAMVMTWIGPALDAAAVLLLGALLWRLGRDPGAAWQEREARLQEIFDDLRALVAQSEGLARELDGKLAGREERLQALLAEAREASGRATAERAASRPARVETRDEAAASAASPRTAAPVEAPGTAVDPLTGVNPVTATVNRPTSAAGKGASGAQDPVATAARIETLADAGQSAEEIARKLGIAVAEVRLVIGLRAARAARRKPVAAETRAHA